MVRLAISVEGQTEEKFVKQVLGPYLAKKSIYITPISMDGNISVDSVTAHVNKLIHSYDYVTTLYDFYGFQKKAADDTKSSLEQKIANKTGAKNKRKFIPYIQMYEFEGLLFASPEHIGAEFNDEKLTRWAQKILTDFDDNPEKVNDSPQTAPSKRFEKDTPYKKTIHGPAIAQKIGIDKIRNECKGFHEWLTKLEALATA